MNTKSIGIATAIAAALMPAGCGRMEMFAEKPRPAPTPPVNAPVPKRPPDDENFVPPENRDAVALKQQLDRECEIRKQLEVDKKALEAERLELLAEVARLRVELAQANSAIDEANAMMLKLEKRLGQWKTNVLGYRAEIMAELLKNQQLLLRCVKGLGVEAPVEVPPVRPPATQPAAKTQPAPGK